jgi:acyl-CoA thioesterase FadM
VSGLLRNLLTLLQAWLFSGALDASSKVASHFWVMPWDAGISVLKSDKYLQFAEAAQLDYLVKTRLLRVLLRRGLSFVNAAQLVKFTRPIGMFSKVRVETSIVYADEKCAYFSHGLFLGSVQHGEVLVKMKFKKSSITVPPGELIAHSFVEKPLYIATWDRALDAM